MSTPGRFIVIEGLEGAGKTTTIETIRHFLEAKNCPFIVTREPGGTRIGEGLRSLVKECVDGEHLDARSELLMMYAARVQLLEEVIHPALRRGDWVIADRFEPSTYAYQGGGRGISRQVLDSLSDICLQNFKPDLIFFLDISPLQGLMRVKGRGKPDRIEQESMAFFDRVHAAYHHYIKDRKDVFTIDASLSPDVVKNSIVLQLEHFFQENNVLN